MTTDEKTVVSTVGRPSRSWEWVAPLTGAVFVVMAIVGFAISGVPKDAAHSPEEIVDWYTSHTGSVQVGAFLAVIAAALFVFFAGYLRTILRAAEGERGMLSLVSFAGTLVIAAGLAIDATLMLAIAERADDIAPESVQTLQALRDFDFVPMAVGTVIFLWATGISILRHGALNRWFGWALIVLGILAVTPAGFIAYLGMALWILVVSVVLLVRGDPTASRAS
jgi:hypothetical protein